MATSSLALATKPMPAAAGHAVVSGEFAIVTSNDQPRGT
jgi:hypothetical protein